MAERTPEAGRDSVEFGRGLSFFDAVFGFALTLLVANLDPPPPADWRSFSLLFSDPLLHQLLGFAVSFVVIAVFWKVNYNLLSRFTGVNGVVIVANLVTVAFVVLIPFTTQGISDPGLNHLPVPVAVYSLNIAAAITAQAIMYELGRRTGLVAVAETPRALWAARVDVAGKVAVFLLAIPVAFWFGADWGRLFWALLLITAPLTGRWSARVAARERDRGALAAG